MVAYLPDADFGGANLEGAMLAGAHLVRANFSRANLTGAQCYEAKMTAAIFDEAWITGTAFHDVDLTDAWFHGAFNVDQASFLHSNIEGAMFDNGYSPPTTLPEPPAVPERE